MKPPTIPANPFMLAWYKLPGLVYFFRAGGAIKIGVAAVSKGKTLQDAVTRRMKQIQSANHEQVELLGIIPFETGDMPTFEAETRERELHNQFASSLRFKQHTIGAEWFDSTEGLLSYVSENTKTPDALGLPRTIATRRDTAGGPPRLMPGRRYKNDKLARPAGNDRNIFSAIFTSLRSLPQSGSSSSRTMSSAAKISAVVPNDSETILFSNLKPFLKCRSAAFSSAQFSTRS
jgi:hypothetical protein